MSEHEEQKGHRCPLQHEDLPGHKSGPEPALAERCRTWITFLDLPTTPHQGAFTFPTNFPVVSPLYMFSISSMSPRYRPLHLFRHLVNSRSEPILTSSQEDAFHSKPMINISVPDHIQAMLVDDWENITKNNQLVPLPHAKPVSKIFEDYLAVERPRREEGSSSMDILEEVIAGFREYFEKALSRILLYRYAILALLAFWVFCLHGL